MHLLLAQVLASAVHAAPLTLEAAREVAVSQAIAVEQAAAAADRAQSAARGVRAGALPSVTGEAGASFGSGFTAFGFPRPVQQQYSVGVGAAWTVVAPSTWGAASAARRTAEGTVAMAEWARLEARRQATTAFTAALAAEREAEAWERSSTAASRIAEVVQELVDRGLRPPAEAARARADAAAAQAERATAQAAATARCAELLALLRRLDGPAPQCELVAPAPQVPLEAPPAHPALTAAALALDAATSTRSSAVGGFLPTLDLDAGAAWYRADDGGGPGWSASADLAVPIFASGLRAAELDAADAALVEARLTLEGERLRLVAALASAEVRHTAAQEALQAREEAVTAARAAQELVQARYQTGVDDLTTLLQARQAWEQAAVARARAEAELGAALAALEAARGVSTSR